MRGDIQLYNKFKELNIKFDYYEHHPLPTIKEAFEYWKNIDSSHCKNLFFRNHKGNKHYLVIIDYLQDLNIKDLESRLKQGKISFASEIRLKKHLGVEPGSVTPFGLIHDIEKNVHVFIDENLQNAERLSFHPNVNTASIIISKADFLKFMENTGNSFEFIKLYD